MAAAGNRKTEVRMEHFFESRGAASLAAAEHVVAALQRQLIGQPRASMVVSGGSTPAQCFKALANKNLDWSRVQVLLSDERWVPPIHKDSNEKMLRETLLLKKAADAELLSFFTRDQSVDERSKLLNAATDTLTTPFACSLLGMGDDGHFASLFPDSKELETNLDLENPDYFVPVATAASPHPRISLTLSALTNSDDVLLLFFGADKRDIYEQAKASRDAFPVSRLLFQTRAPVHVFWAR